MDERFWNYANFPILFPAKTGFSFRYAFPALTLSMSTIAKGNIRRRYRSFQDWKERGYVEALGEGVSE